MRVSSEVIIVSKYFSLSVQENHKGKTPLTHLLAEVKGRGRPQTLKPHR